MRRITSLTHALLLTLLLCIGFGSSASAACHEEGQRRSQAPCTCCSPQKSSCCQPNVSALPPTNTAHTLTPCPCALKPYSGQTTHALPGVSFDYNVLLPQTSPKQPFSSISVPLFFSLETHSIFRNHSPPLPSRAPPHA